MKTLSVFLLCVILLLKIAGTYGGTATTEGLDDTTLESQQTTAVPPVVETTTPTELITTVDLAALCDVTDVLETRRSITFIISDCLGGLYEMTSWLMYTEDGSGFLVNATFNVMSRDLFPQEVLGVYLRHDDDIVLTYGMLAIADVDNDTDIITHFDLYTGVLIHNNTYNPPTMELEPIDSPHICAMSQEAARGTYRLYGGAPVPFFGKDILSLPWELDPRCVPYDGPDTTSPSDKDGGGGGGDIIGECGLIALIMGGVLCILAVVIVILLVCILKRTSSGGGGGSHPRRVHPSPVANGDVPPPGGRSIPPKNKSHKDPDQTTLSMFRNHDDGSRSPSPTFKN